MRHNIVLTLWVGIGGFIGTSLRYLIDTSIKQNTETNFPLSTFLINILGSFILGIVSELSINSIGKHEINILLSIGLCGGFTTFSTFMLDNYNLVEDSNYFVSIIYVISSIIIGFVFLFLGKYLTKLFIK